MQFLAWLYAGAALLLSLAINDQTHHGHRIFPGRWAPRLAWFVLGVIASWWCWVVVLRFDGAPEWAVTAHAQPARLDVPPSYQLEYAAGGRQLQIRWLEQSDATDRWLVVLPSGALTYFAPDELDVVLSTAISADAWQSGSTFQLCRRWVVDPVEGIGDETRCHTAQPWPRTTLFLPAARR